MAECRIVDKLAKFVPVRNDVLLMSVLRLLHNLSFDTVLRDSMVKNGLIPKASTCMHNPTLCASPACIGLPTLGVQPHPYGMPKYTACTLTCTPCPALPCAHAPMQSVELMVAPRFQPVVLGLLYHVSMEDKYKSLFTYTDCIPRVYEMLMRVQVGQHEATLHLSL